METMDEIIRAFIAVEISDEMREELRRIQAKLKKEFPANGISWVKPENIHLTLKFLGDINQEQAGEIKNILRDLALQISPFHFSLSELNAFPKMYNPRVIWIGLKSGIENFEELSAKLEEALVLLSFGNEDKKFHPHLTLARVRYLQDKNILKNIRDKISVKEISADANHLCLFQSTLTPHGPVYNKICEEKFQITDSKFQI